MINIHLHHQTKAKVSIPIGHRTQATGRAIVQQTTGVMAGALRPTQTDVKIGVKLATTALAMEEVQLGTS